MGVADREGNYVDNTALDRRADRPPRNVGSRAHRFLATCSRQSQNQTFR
jgi:hypothetical protein